MVKIYLKAFASKLRSFFKKMPAMSVSFRTLFQPLNIKLLVCRLIPTCSHALSFMALHYPSIFRWNPNPIQLSPSEHLSSIYPVNLSRQTFMSSSFSPGLWHHLLFAPSSLCPVLLSKSVFGSAEDPLYSSSSVPLLSVFPPDNCGRKHVSHCYIRSNVHPVRDPAQGYF